jgi:sugar phosphate isomerase/epimerase
MGHVGIRINLEFVRHADKSLVWGLEKAAALGYEFVEPWVHLGREMMSEAGYSVNISIYEDPLRIKALAARFGVKLSAISWHSPLCKPDVSGNYLKQAISFAYEAGAPVVCTEEGPKPNGRPRKRTSC